MRLKALTLALTGMIVGIAPLHAQEGDPAAAAATRLSQSIRQARFERVGILPWLVSEKETGYYTPDPDVKQAAPALTSSLHTKLYIEQLQNQLAERSGGAFRTVDAFLIGDALRGAGVEPAKLQANDPALKKLPELVDGGLDGVIVGAIRDRPMEEGSEYSVRDIAWKLLDAKDLSMVAAPQNTTTYSLADLVYDGRSGEFFRWNQGRLWVLGFRPENGDLSKAPLNPRDSTDLYKINVGPGFDPHPIFNPNCPYKVRFLVEGEERKLVVPVSKEARIEFNYNGPERRWAYDDSAYLTLNPGESWSIETKNATNEPALVAVFVDGINILGKKRELPDQTCHAWGLKAGATGNFKGWFSGPKGQEQIEEFVITPYSDSVAGKLGETAQLGSITLVFFSSGWPQRARLAMTERPYHFYAHWDDAAGKLVFEEKMEPEPRQTLGSANMGSFDGARSDMFAVGGKRPQSHPLAYGSVGAPGVLLCAMTIHYGSDEDVANYVDSGASSWQTSLSTGPQSDENGAPTFELLEASTNGHRE